MTNLRKRSSYFYLRFILLLGFVAYLIFSHPLIASSKEDQKNVLFISSYSENFITVPQQIEGLLNVFSTADQNISLDIEYMDTKRFATDENIALFYENLRYKLSNLPIYDAILVGDDAALQFAMDYQEDLFPDVPIIFFGINNKDRATLADTYPNMAGSTEETSISENIKIAYRFNPTATKVVAIVDSTLTGQGDEKQFMDASALFPDLEFTTLNASEHTSAELGTILESYTNDTILLFMTLSEDSTGQFLTLDDSISLIAEHAKIPVYRHSIGGVGEGLIGGKMIDYVKMAEYSANLVVDVLSGTDVNSIALEDDTPYFYYFDYELIEKYNIDDDQIPEEAVLLNKEVYLWDKYRNVFISLGICIIFLFILSLILIIDNIKTKIMKKRLQESHEELTALYEELSASEELLHDQFDRIQEHSDEINLLYQKYDIAIRSTNSAVWELDVATDEIQISDTIIRSLNKKINQPEKAEVIRELLFHKDYRDDLHQEVQRYIRGEISEINIQVPTNDSDGPRKWMLIRGKGIQESDSQMKKIYGILLDITAIKEQEEYIEYMASHDFLTNLPNRMEFMKVLAGELKRASHGTVFLLDIDNFKSINDTLGHIYGDKLLKQIAARLSNIQDKQVVVARLGGDEFLVLIKEVSEYEKVNQYVQMIKSVFAEPFVFEGTENFINFSMGITCYPEDSDNINQLIMNADTAMYKVKQGGRNNYVYYREDMKNEIESKRNIENQLRLSLKENGFCLYYQPQVDVILGTIVGFEALIRIDAQTISPSIFIPIAEETGSIIDIGRWVAREAVSQIASWRDKGFPEKPVAINFSSKQLRDKGYIDYIKQLLTEFQVSPRLLEIEITEGILLENDIQTIDFLAQLKKEGFSIALDDFGTGYSSLNYLTYIPVDVIKLDKSINDKFLDYNDSKVMDSLISLSHSLNLKIVAEGIEEWDKFEKLRDGGCDYIQGYLFSNPLPVEEIEKIYESNLLEMVRKGR